MEAVGVGNCNTSQNHGPHDCAADAVTRISLARRHGNKARPDTLLTRSPARALYFVQPG